MFIAKGPRRSPSAGAAAIMLGLTGASPSPAQSLPDCEQADRAWLALRLCSQLIDGPQANDSDRGRALTRRGFAWLIEDEPIQAAADFSRALAIDAGNVRALEGRARARTIEEKHDLAAADWTAAIEKSRDESEVEKYRLERGVSLIAAGRLPEALADYDKVLAAKPESVEGMIGRANVFAAQGARAWALSEYDRAKAIDPKNFAPYLAQAEAAERWGDSKMAIENYSTALSLKTTVWTARKALKRLGIDTPP